MNSTHFSYADAMRQQQEDRQRVAAIKAAEEKQLRKEQVDSLYRIAESTKALLPPIQKQAEAAQEQAEASMIQAQLALKKAKKADVKGILALIFSAIALVIDVIVNRREILEFIYQLFGI